jgi:putative drug exporter of the RND superfamily
VHAVFTAIGRFSVRFRWLVVAIWLVATAAAVILLPSLSSVTQTDNANFLPASAPSMHATTLVAPFQKSNETAVTVVVSRSSGQLDAADTTAIGTLSSALHTVSNVTAVRDLGRSPDGAAEQLSALATVNLSDRTGLTTLVKDLRSAISTTALPSDLQAHLTGSIPEQIDNSAQSGNSGNSIEQLSVLFIIVLLVLIFRSALAPLITLAPAFVVVELAGPLIAVATHAGLQVSSLAQLMLIVLVLGAGTDYGLFLVFRVREAIRNGMEMREAVVHSLGRVGESITFSAGTVIAALLSLLAASFGIYSNLGIPLAIGIGLMLLAGLTLLPALLAIFGRAVFWPSKLKVGGNRVGLWGRVSTRIVRRPLVTLVIGLVFFGGLSFAVLGYTAGGFGGQTAPPSGSDSAAGAAAVNAHFPQTNANPTTLVFTLKDPAWQDPAALETATGKLKADSGEFTTVNGPLNPTGAPLSAAQFSQLRAALGPASALPPIPPPGSKVPVAVYEAYRASAQFVSADGHSVLFEVGLKAGDPSGTAAINAVPTIRADVTQVATAIGATDSGVAGEAPALYDVSSISTSDLQTVIPIAIAIIAVLLGLVMRSVVAPIYLIVSVGLSYLAALGLSVLLFGHNGLTFILPFLMFLFLLALGEDYNILVMTRIREEAKRLPLKEAVTKALEATGTTVTSAGLVLAGTFAVFAIAGGSAGGSEVTDIGAGIALGVLMDTFLVRTVLVPSTVVLLGRWNWWPSKLGRRDKDLPPPQHQEAEPAPAGSRP